MISDQQTVYSDAQAVTSTGNSTNIYDHGAAGSLGAGKTLKQLLFVSAVAGTNPTLQAKFVGADDSGFSTNKITICDTGSLAPPVAGTLYRVAIPHHTPKRYFRWEYTIGGTGSPSVTITAAHLIDEQTTPMT